MLCAGQGADLELDEAATEHNAKMKRLEWAIQEDEAAPEAQAPPEQEPAGDHRRANGHTYRKIIAAGDVERFALRLSQHPDETPPSQPSFAKTTSPAGYGHLAVRLVGIDTGRNRPRPAGPVQLERSYEPLMECHVKPHFLRRHPGRSRVRHATRRA